MNIEENDVLKAVLSGILLDYATAILGIRSEHLKILNMIYITIYIEDFKLFGK